MPPSITIIVPAYDVEKYIETAIKSVLAQTVKFDELIIIDDGSTDNTLHLIKSIDYDIPVKIITQKNSGQGIARNKGIELSSSDYLYFFDSDDLLEEDACATMKKELNQYSFPDIFLFEGTTFFDSDRTSGHFSPSYSRPFSGYFTDRKDLFSAINKSNDLSCSPCLYLSKRSLWQNNLLTFNQYFHEDEELFYRLLLAGNHYLVGNQKLFKRRLRLGSTMTMVKSFKHVNGQIANLKTLHELIKLYGTERILGKALRKRLYRFTLRYYSTCLKASANVNWEWIIKSFFRSRNPLLIPHIFYLRLRMALHGST